jgi:MFS family permease
MCTTIARRLTDDLDHDLRIVLAGVLVSALGVGMTLPYFQVSLYRVHGLSPLVTGLFSASMGMTGLGAMVAAGVLCDRFGSGRVLAGACLASATGAAMVAAGSGLGWLAGGALLLGAGSGLLLPALNSRIGTATSGAARWKAFALQYWLLNAGIGLGALIGASAVTASKPATFRGVYGFEAVTFAVFACLALATRNLPGGASAGAPPVEAAAPGGHGYRAAVADTRLGLAAATVGLVVLAGYAPLETTLPLYLTREVGLSTAQVGVAYALNTLVVLAAQLPVAWVGPRRPARLLLVQCCAWSLAWIMLAAAAVPNLRPLVPRTVALLALAVLGAGETLYALGMPVLVNQIAPDHLRGRYNAVVSASWQGSMVLGPVLGGSLLRLTWPPWYAIGQTAWCFAAAISARWLADRAGRGRQEEIAAALRR